MINTSHWSLAMSKNHFRFLAFFLFVGSLFTSCQEMGSSNRTKESTPPLNRTFQEERFNSPEQIKKPIVVMISIDGFRHDYLEKYKPSTLLSWAQNGVRADGIIPSFPTLTFPNHVSLVTGLRPGHHGIVGNKFFDEKRKEFYSMGSNITVNDGSWYRGTPLWTAAEKQGMLAATCFWVGSEAKIGGIDPTYLKPYDGAISNKQRVLWVTQWLSLPENKRPHFIGLYFSDVDSMGHKYGPDSNETRKAVLDIDFELGELKKFIAQNNLDVQIIVVSDHGMKNIDKTVDLSPALSIRNLKNTGKGALVTFYSDSSADVERAYQEIKKISGDFDVYKTADYPKRWQLDDTDRQGDLIVIGHPGVYIGFEEGFTKTAIGSSNKATHGWDSADTADLNGVFIAFGSQFKPGTRIPAFDNIHVYPLVMDILKLKQIEVIDGDAEVLKPILRSKFN
jgi:predicted AlkP superfamily pyrophosphatase or phosphodiesterase